MTGGKSPRQKGDRAERELASLLGWKRVPGSGAGVLPDLVSPDGKYLSVKRLKRGLVTLQNWLSEAKGQGAMGVAFRQDNGEWSVTLPLEEFKRLMGVE